MGHASGWPLAAGLLTVLAAFPVAWLIARRRSWLSVLVERATYVASSLPGVVIALALVTLSVRYARPVYQTSVVLVAAYAILFIPRAMVTIRAAIAHAPEELTDAARALGDGPFRAFLRVLVPLTAPGALAGFAMVFIADVDRADGDAAARTHRHADTGDGVLERE